MKTVGQVFKLKESLKEISSELIPSFGKVLKSYLGEPIDTKFKDPNYVIDITFPTLPLQIFMKKALEALDRPVVQGIYLTKGFGFGKTHVMILLWHILNSKEGVHSRLARELKFKEELARETLVLGIDFSFDKPFDLLLKQLKAIAERRPEQWQVKDPKLSQAAIEALKNASMVIQSSEDLAELVVKVLERYKELGGRSRLLLLVDEMGFGVYKRLTSYVETKNLEKYREIELIINFITHLYSKLNASGIPTYIIIAFAEQDKRGIDNLYLRMTDDRETQEKIDGIRRDLELLKERLSRAVGGISESDVLSYDLRHIIDISKHRVLKSVEDEESAKETFLSYLALQAREYNLLETFKVYEEQIKSSYPLSPSMAWLLRKIVRPYEAPKTEYVRTAIVLLARAAENALNLEPSAPAIGVKHLPFEMTGPVDLMGDFESDWAIAISDVEHAVKSAAPELRKSVDTIAKQILSKGMTANVMALLEAESERDLKSYGVTLEEIQLDLLATWPSEEAVEALGKLREAVEYLKIQSARIEEREFGARKFYVLSPLRTIYDKLAVFKAEHEKRLETPAQIPGYLREIGLANILSLGAMGAIIPGREKDVDVFLNKDYRALERIEGLINDRELREAQSKGRLSIVIVPPWDVFLFNELFQRKREYGKLMEEIAEKLQSAIEKGEISHPLHLLILIPNLSESKLARLLEDVVSYAATKEFISHLRNRERIVKEKIGDYERTVRKRLAMDLRDFLEQREKLEAGMKSIIERQITDALRHAQEVFVRLTRKVTVGLLELYEKMVLYDEQSGKFILKDLHEPVVEASKGASKLEEEKESDLQKYSAVTNMFFRKVIETARFTWDSKAVLEAILKHYREEMEKGVFRDSDSISDIAENAMQGVYGVRPLSLNVVRDAMGGLNGRTLEVENVRVKFNVREEANRILFEIEEMKPPEVVELPPQPSTIAPPPPPPPSLPVRTLEKAVVEVGEGFDFNEFRQRLDLLYHTYGQLVNYMAVKADGSGFRAMFEFLGLKHEVSHILQALNFLKHLSEKYKATLQLEIGFAEPLLEDKVREILGPFFSEKVRRSWDRLLPS
ncbi:MAG: hypothetical protein P3X22_001000 [Thermoprotei archaeon]|nr:hypothetical protein [Thermoprotei archaeon]